MAKNKVAPMPAPNTKTNIVDLVRKVARYFEKHIWPEDIKDYKDYVVYTSKYDKK